MSFRGDEMLNLISVVCTRFFFLTYQIFFSEHIFPFIEMRPNCIQVIIRRCSFRCILGYQSKNVQTIAYIMHQSSFKIRISDMDINITQPRVAMVNTLAYRGEDSQLLCTLSKISFHFTWVKIQSKSIFQNLSPNFRYMVQKCQTKVQRIEKKFLYIVLFCKSRLSKMASTKTNKIEKRTPLPKTNF